MIDIEDEVIDLVARIFSDGQDNVFVVGGDKSTMIESYPAVVVTEQDSRTYDRTRTQEKRENHVKNLYKIEVCSNKGTGRRSECKRIANKIDLRLQEKGFTRTAAGPVENLADRTVYRYVLRYEGIVSEDHIIYRS